MACKNITLIGRRWFQKTYGNTYHSVTVLLDGEPVHNSGRCYGYGDQYEQTGLDWLQANGHIDRTQHANGSHEPMWQYAERADISEEVVRLRAHLEHFAEVCEGSSSAGRKLDFLTQEMLREANTIGSKSNDARIARCVVEMKAAIGRIKEQVQNVE